MTDEMQGGGSAISYTLTIEDYVAFNLYHAAHSPAAKRTKWRTLIGMGVAVYGACAIVAMSTKQWYLLGTAIPAILIAVLVGALRHNRHIESHVRKQFREGRNAELLSPHTIWVLADGLRATSANSDSTVRWPGIERIAESADHLLIYLSAVQAIVIPRHRIDAGDYSAFVTALRGTIPDRFLPLGASATPKGPVPPPYTPSGPVG